MSDQGREERRQRELDELTRLFRAGIDSGPRIPADQVFAALRNRYAPENKDK